MTQFPVREIMPIVHRINHIHIRMTLSSPQATKASTTGIGRKAGQLLTYVEYATTSYPLEGVKRPWDPGCLANISRRVSPHTRVP